MRRGGTGALVLAGVVSTLAFAADREIDRLMKQLLAQPVPHVPSGFTARILVHPGDIFYDPLYMLPLGDEVWVMDDGGQKGDRGSQIVVLDRQGKIKRVPVPIGKVFPLAGMAVAPQGFGSYGGQVFTVNQGGVDYPGTAADSHIQRINPRTGEVTTFCNLPRVKADQPSGWPSQGAFGPPGSPFAGRLFAATASNRTVYQITPDGKCVPFVTFPDHSPAFVNFTPDGNTMLVPGFRGAIVSRQGGAVLRVAPDGKVDPEPMLEMPELIGPLVMAPEEFGPYGGQWFFCVRSFSVGRQDGPRPLAQALAGNGVVYRLTPEGKAEVFATAFRNPIIVAFLDDKTLWVADEGHQFYQRELPDGAIVEIKAP